MPYLKLQNRQYPLAAGETTIGAFDGATIRLPSGDPAMRAVVLMGPSGVSIRLGAPTAVVMINGVQLGPQPIPLLHGDRVEIAGHELRLGEDQKGGSTQFVSAAELAKLTAVKAPPTAPKKPTTATGGRLVSLVDGREYAVSDSGLTFGREVGNDVVIASNEISRKHASIAPAADGYVLTDHSTNGVWVNGSRVSGEQTLGRGDVIKMGAEEFRFYADVAKAAPPAAPVPPAVPAATPAPPPAVSGTPSLAATAMARPGATPPPKPVSPPPVSKPPVAPAAPPVAPKPAVAAAAPAAAPASVPTARAALATLEVIAEGPLKGLTFEVHSALTNIGRGDHNDIVIKEDSISDSHAKIQKRADGWYLVDQESTNGTYLGGRRVQGEVRIEGSPDVRFGGIKMTFRAISATATGEGGGTRAIAAVNVEALRRQAGAKPTPAIARAQPPVAPPPEKKGCASVIALFVAIAGAGVGLFGLFLLTGR